MSEVIVVAVITTRDGTRDAAEKLIAETILPATHAEAGCVRYALHRDTRDANRLVFIERWESAEALGEHIQSDHMNAFKEAVGPLAAAPFDISVLEGVALGDPSKGTLAGA